MISSSTFVVQVSRSATMRLQYLVISATTALLQLVALPRAVGPLLWYDGYLCRTHLAHGTMERVLEVLMNGSWSRPTRLAHHSLDPPYRTTDSQGMNISH